MPTYQYRCLQCRQSQTQVHGMHETTTPACQICGGLTEKIIGQAPTVLKTLPPTEMAPPPEPAHDCGSACVLHHPKKPKP